MDPRQSRSATHKVKASQLRSSSRPLIPSSPFHQAASPRLSPQSPVSPTSTKRQRSSGALSKGTGSSGALASDGSSSELKSSPRFGLEPQATSTSVHLEAEHCVSPAQARQARAEAAHITRRREAASGANRTHAETAKRGCASPPQARSASGGRQSSNSHACHPILARTEAQLEEIENGSGSGALESVASCSDADSDIDACSLFDSSSSRGQVSKLCQRVDTLMQELVAIVGPPTPPLTPTTSARVTDAHISHGAVDPPTLDNATESVGNPPAVIPAIDNDRTLSTASTEATDSDVQFRISRLELQVSQIMDTKNEASTNEQVAKLKDQLDILRTELLATREEARETRAQLDTLAKRTSVLEALSGSFAKSPCITPLENADVCVRCADERIHRLSSVSSDGSQILLQAPAAQSHVVERSLVQLPRARSTESVNRHRLYSLARSGALRSQNSLHGPVEQQTAPNPRRRASPPPPRVADVRMCTVEQLMKQVQHRPFCLQKKAHISACAKPGKLNNSSWRLCTRSPKSTNNGSR